MQRFYFCTGFVSIISIIQAQKVKRRRAETLLHAQHTSDIVAVPASELLPVLLVSLVGHSASYPFCCPSHWPTFFIFYLNEVYHLPQILKIWVYFLLVGLWLQYFYESVWDWPTHFCIHTSQVGTSTRMVTTETTATPFARLAPDNPTDPRLRRAMSLAAALTSSTTPASTQRMVTA